MARTAAAGVRLLETGAMAISALSIAAMVAIVCAEVAARSVFGVSTLISSEFAGYLLVANVYLGLAWTFRDGGFIRVELLHSLLQGRVAAAANAALAAIATCAFVIYTWHLAGFVAQNHASGATSVFITRTPLWIPQLAMPVGAGLMTAALFVALVQATCELLRPGWATQAPVGREAREEAGVL